jgi:hypothetical protein
MLVANSSARVFGVRCVCLFISDGVAEKKMGLKSLTLVLVSIIASAYGKGALVRISCHAAANLHCTHATGCSVVPQCS